MVTKLRVHPTVSQLKFLNWVKLHYEEDITYARMVVLNEVIAGEGYVTFSNRMSLRQKILNNFRNQYLDTYILSKK